MAEIDEKSVNSTEQKPQSEVGSSPSEPNKAVNKAETDEIYRLKTALSKANSEAASWRKQYEATLDEAKRKEFDAAQQRKAELEELEALRNDKRISTYKTKLMEAGIDGATADLMANALPDGVKEDYFTSLKTYNEKQKQAFAATAISNQPGLSVGLPPTAADAKKEEENRYRKYMGLPPI